MLKYIIKRILASIATIIGIIFLINLFIELSPGDPGRLILGMNASPEQGQILNHSLVYDQPFLKRFFEYIIGVFTRLDLGTSYKYGVSVWEKICSRIPTTFIVALTTVVIDSILSVFLGIVCVKNKDSKIDAVISTVAGFTSAIPSYWLGVVLLLIFCFKLRFFSVYDMGNSVAGYVLPVATVVIITFGPLVKKTRAVLLDVMNQDYIRTARALGEGEWSIIWKYAMKNALLPIITIIGYGFTGLMGGTLIIEQVFSLMGIGTLMLTAIQTRDVPLVCGITVVISVIFCLVQLLVDILYIIFDPRLAVKIEK